jgi:hypothetical protein
MRMRPGSRYCMYSSPIFHPLSNSRNQYNGNNAMNLLSSYKYYKKVVESCKCMIRVAYHIR